MKILAFDQSTTVTGWSLIEDGICVDYGLIDLRREKRFEVRFKQMCLSIFQAIDKFKPAIVAIEDTYNSNSPKVLKSLSQLQGAIIAYCNSNDISYSIILPTHWRSTLGFNQGKSLKRNDLKKQAVDFIKAKYGIISTSDEADAICIGVAYWMNFNGKVDVQ